jgi:RNA polymerase sigma-70 factor (sigma-E family)
MERSAYLGCQRDVTEPLAIEVAEETETFASLYASHFDQLVRLASLLTSSSMVAEDIVQEAFAKLHNRYDRIDVPQAWLRVAVVNACSNERRRLGTARRLAPRLASESVTTEEPKPELIASLRRLPDRQRAVVVLRFYLDLSEADIAETLGMRPGTVKSSLHRALARLQTEVER